MGVNGFTVGRDVAVDIQTPAGLVTFRNFTEFQSKALRERRQSNGMDGVSRKLHIPMGWEGSMRYDRMDSTVDDYFAQEDLNYYNGQGIQAITITETITETDGSVNTYQYTGVQWTLENAGTKRGDDKVDQSITFEASFRTKLN